MGAIAASTALRTLLLVTALCAALARRHRWLWIRQAVSEPTP